MSLSAAQRQELNGALLSAFTVSELAQLTKLHLNLDLDSISSGDLSQRVLALVTWAETQDRYAELIGEAFRANPGNQNLQTIVRRALDKRIEQTNPGHVNVTDAAEIAQLNSDLRYMRTQMDVVTRQQEAISRQQQTITDQTRLITDQQRTIIDQQASITRQQETITKQQESITNYLLEVKGIRTGSMSTVWSVIILIMIVAIIINIALSALHIF